MITSYYTIRPRICPATFVREREFILCHKCRAQVQFTLHPSVNGDRLLIWPLIAFCDTMHHNRLQPLCPMPFFVQGKNGCHHIASIRTWYALIFLHYGNQTFLENNKFHFDPVQQFHLPFMLLPHHNSHFINKDFEIWTEMECPWYWWWCTQLYNRME